MNDNERRELAEILFPNIKITRDEIEAKYPERQLKEGAKVTRFAPSPTGFMHVGNLEGAFLDYVFAKQSNGVFYLRLEDTDQERFVEGANDLIKNTLNMYGIMPEEGAFSSGNYGPYVQSERKEIYQAYIKDLIIKGLAYPCFMTKEELQEIREGQELRKEAIGIYGHYAVDRDLSLDEVKKHLDNGDNYVIRIKSPGEINNTVILHDLIKGDITMPENMIDEVIMKKDGLPTYHFAHVIDDHLMHTTTVIRGDEWIPSYPKHLQLSQILGFKPLKYAHHAPLTKKDEETGNIRKLSKRKDPEFSVGYYEQAGIPVEGVKLFLSTIVNTNFEEWYLQNPEKSYLDFQFSFKKMPVGGTLFDVEKLNNICRTYFSRISAEDIYNMSLEYFEKYDEKFFKIMKENKDRLIGFLDIERNGKRPRKDIATLKDVKTESIYMFDEYFFENKEKTYSEIDKTGIDIELLKKYLDIFDAKDDNETWYSKIQTLASDNGYASSVKEYKNNPDNYKGHIGDICEMIRHVVTGKNQTPNLSNILSILGKENIEERINFFEK
ncbi:MAG: glutamate--tRNA ligase [Bacilli bacterium]|nr:glutamate--tRNA ligase [Bacilli bacterium]